MLRIEFQAVVPGRRRIDFPVRKGRLAFEQLPVGPNLEGMDQRAALERDAAVKTAANPQRHPDPQGHRCVASPFALDAMKGARFPWNRSLIFDRYLCRISA